MRSLRDVAGVVARVALVLVGRVVLLVDHDQPEVAHRREDGRARADRDPRLAAPQPPPLVVALALAERRVQQRDGVAEARLEAPDGLRRERDLRHEHDHARAALERRRGRAQVDLGLARAGDAVEQVRAARGDRGDRAACSAVSSTAASACGHGQRRAPPVARPDRHQPARLEPPQRAEVAARGPRQRGEQRPLVLGQPLAVQRARPSAPPTARSAACRAAAARATARAPASSSTPPPSTARARRAPAGTESARTARRRDELLRRHLGRRRRARPRRRRAPGARTAPARPSRPPPARRAARSRTARRAAGWW